MLMPPDANAPDEPLPSSRSSDDGPDVASTTDDDPTPTDVGRGLFHAGLWFELGLGAVAVAWAYWRGLPMIDALPWSSSIVLQSVIATLPLVVALLILMRVDAPWMQRIEAHVRSFLRPILQYGGLAGMAVLALAAGVGEELLFRGVVQAELVGLIGPWGALIIASIIFGVCHWITPAYALIATIMGAYLGGLYMYTGGLTVPILVHTFYDFVAFAYFAWTEKQTSTAP